MKIGIVTQQIVGNYGGILQNYALQSTLRKLGHTPVTIDYRETYMTLKEYRKRKWRYIRRTIKFKHPEPVGPRYRHRTSAEIERFVDSYIAVTPMVTDYSDKVVRKQNFDCLIVGSDQVWRPIYNPGVMDDMFLRFAEDWDVKRIAYAASFGTGKREINDEVLSVASRLIPKFDYVSVREESGVPLFETYFGFQPDWVADPTLLVKREEYDGIIDGWLKQSATKNSSGQHIFKYILDNRSETDAALEILQDKLNVSDIKTVEDQDKTVSIEMWLNNIRGSRMVLTDSFHGTIFSIIFQKPFVAFCNKDRGADRFLSILSRFGLQDRLVYEDTAKEDIIKAALAPIDWSSVQSKLESFREESLSKLSEALK